MYDMGHTSVGVYLALSGVHSENSSGRRRVMEMVQSVPIRDGIDKKVKKVKLVTSDVSKLPLNFLLLRFVPELLVDL